MSACVPEFSSNDFRENGWLVLMNLADEAIGA